MNSREHSSIKQLSDNQIMFVSGGRTQSLPSTKIKISNEFVGLSSFGLPPPTRPRPEKK